MQAEIIPSEPDPGNAGEGKRLAFSCCRFCGASSRSFIAVKTLVSSQVSIVSDMIEVSINQKTYSVPEAGTLEDVLSLLEIRQADGIAIALNEVVIPRAEWSEHPLRAEDRVFVIRATQGG